MQLSRETAKRIALSTGWTDIDEFLYAGATSKIARRDRWWSFIGWTDACGTNAPVQPSRMAKNPTSQNFYSPVDPTILISSVGSTGDNKKKPSLSRTGISLPATFGKHNDWRIKSSPKELKFCRDDHKDLVNIPTKGIDESLHGLGGIKEFSSKNGVFFRTQKASIRKSSWILGILY